jgi:hypothetical protein
MKVAQQLQCWVRIDYDDSVPDGTIEAVGSRSRLRLCERKEPSIVPSGTGQKKRLPSTEVPGYFYWVPPGLIFFPRSRLSLS